MLHGLTQGQNTMKDDGLGDWRIRATSTLAKTLTSADGHVYKVGTPVTLMTVSEDKKGQVLSFTTPSASALALSIAVRAVRRAKELQEKLTFTEKAESHPISHDKLELESRISLITNDSSLYDFFEECMVAVTFSFQALETFSNMVIAEKLQHTYSLKRRTESLEFTSEELQRKASTAEKLGTILPDILSMKGPKGMKVWQNYKQLQKARDTTIHMKAHDAHSGRNIHEKTLFYKFLRGRVEESPRAAIDMMAFFFQGDQLPRWLVSARDKLTKL
jgi:hypothetical protein